VLIDVGHGGIDGGTGHGELLEKQINLAIGKKLYNQLRRTGICVALNRNHDYAPSDDNQWLNSRSRHLRDLAQRKLIVDMLKPKLTVSLHANWAKQSSVRGPGVLYQSNQPSFIASRLIASKLNQLYGTQTLPYSGKTFYLLSRSQTPAVIVETGFMSNADDRRMLTEEAGQKQITEAIASAVLEYLLVFHME
jgi:N-acetylmuramoyl-L-alanine amidase